MSRPCHVQRQRRLSCSPGKALVLSPSGLFGASQRDSSVAGEKDAEDDEVKKRREKQRRRDRMRDRAADR